ncbi:MAG: phosphotransferase [Lachnospiraceae bacterium]|nr:phosphotransferase [Lachnospiraceae bacterium]
MEEGKILLKLKENYDYKISGIDFLRDGGGTTYIVNGEEQKFFLKIAGKAFHNTIRQSVDIVCYLSRKGFPVPNIIETKLGMPMLEVREQGQEYLLILYEYIDGKEPDLCTCGEKAGKLAGWLHKLLLGYKGTLIERDYHFFVGRYVEILRRKNYPLADTYAYIGAKFWERVKDCPVSVCHGDMHRGNLLETADGKIYLLDFDTICIAPRMFDVMVMCDMTDYFNLQPADIITTKTVYKNFLAGYTHHINLTEAERESFNDWIVIRHFQLQATIVEMFGIDCIDNDFVDRQLQWIRSWEEQLCAKP